MVLNNKQIQKDPNQKDIKFLLKLFNSNQLIDAKKEIDKQIAIYPNSSILYNILGAILAAQDQLDLSIEYYKRAIKINSYYAQAHNYLGIALQKLNKIDEAIEVKD